LTARTPQVTFGTSSATSHRNRRTSCKFETDKNKPKPNKSGTDLLCFVYIYSKGIRCGCSIEMTRNEFPAKLHRPLRVFGI